MTEPNTIQPHRQCAAVLITNKQNQVLLIRQSYGQQFYGLPGGIVDQGETPPTAAIREALEEISVQVEIEYQIGAYLLTGRGWPDVFASIYKAQIVQGQPKADLKEISEVLWCDLYALPSPLTPDTEAALEDFKHGQYGVVRTYQRSLEMPEWVEFS